MTREDIIRMAREAGWQTGATSDDCMECSRFSLERFAALVAEATLEKNNMTWVANCQHLVEAEREAIAQMIEDAPTLVESNKHGGCLMCGFTPKLAAAFIRARGKTE